MQAKQDSLIGLIALRDPGIRYESMKSIEDDQHSNLLIRYLGFMNDDILARMVQTTEIEKIYRNRNTKFPTVNPVHSNSKS
jgi:hypothetical protein